MKLRRWLSMFGFFVILIVPWTASHAQPPCPHADIRLDTEQAVDVDAICDAARPWADVGIRILIFLTDHRPASEDDWFALLDQVEEEAGVRSPDGFDKNVLAFEASTASDLSWAYSVTYGELLYDSPLDTDDAAIFRVKSQMRNGIAAGDPTDAFVQALNTAYEINYPAAAAPLPTEPPSSVAEPEQTQPAPSSNLGTILLLIPVAILVIGGSGIGGYLLYRRLELQRHQEALRTRTSNLLNACYQLLQGDAPEETVLYHLFRAYGGEQYKDVRAQVLDWLRRCQDALDDAFDLRKKLLDPDVQKKRSLAQTVQDWEMLYVTFVGNSERILKLTDDELRTLLDPLLTLDREATDAKLAQQLDDLRRELAGGTGLKVELRMVDPTQTDAEGILGYIDRIKAQIVRLREAPQKAPERLAEAKSRRKQAEKDIPSPFVMTEKQIFESMDEQLAQADAALEQELFLRVIERADEVEQGLETIKSLIATLDDHEKRQAEIDAITDQGYRPENLADDLKEVETNLQTATKKIEAGDYVAAASAIEKVDAGSQQALAGAKAWQALHEQNAVALRKFGDELTRVESYQVGEAASAWERLQTYPRENWDDVADDLDKATQTLRRLREESLREIEQLNSMERQQLSQVESELGQASSDLTQAEQQLQAIARCLKDVQATEARIQRELRATEAEVARAASLRGRGRIGIRAEVDQQIGRARERLTEGRRLAGERKFVAAANAQREARQLATAVIALLLAAQRRRRPPSSGGGVSFSFGTGSSSSSGGGRSSSSSSRRSSSQRSSSRRSSSRGSSSRRSSSRGSSSRRSSSTGSSRRSSSKGSSRRR
jgi:hypothetical protein